jgi:hypothetical protein
MTKLSDTQAIILANASQSFDGNVLPLPGSLRGGAQAKVIIEERTIDCIQPPAASLNRVWRQDHDGRSILLYITKAGLAAIGCEPEDANAADAAPDTAKDGATDGQDAGAATQDATPTEGTPAADAVTDAAEPKERKVGLDVASEKVRNGAGSIASAPDFFALDSRRPLRDRTMPLRRGHSGPGCIANLQTSLEREINLIVRPEQTQRAPGPAWPPAGLLALTSKAEGS